MRKKQKVVPFVPFFYEIKVHNLETSLIVDTDFATTGPEILAVIDRLVVNYPAPTYAVVTGICKRVVK